MYTYQYSNACNTLFTSQPNLGNSVQHEIHHVCMFQSCPSTCSKIRHHTPGIACKGPRHPRAQWGICISCAKAACSNLINQVPLKSDILDTTMMLVRITAGAMYHTSSNWTITFAAKTFMLCSNAAISFQVCKLLVSSAGVCHSGTKIGLQLKCSNALQQCADLGHGCPPLRLDLQATLHHEAPLVVLKLRDGDGLEGRQSCTNTYTCLKPPQD